MRASPAVDDNYRQEFDLGNAEDVVAVSSRTGSASVPGIGLILDLDPASGERTELIRLVK